MGYVTFTRFCRESGFVANTRFFGCLVQTFTQTLGILLRFCAVICPKNWLLGPLSDTLCMVHFGCRYVGEMITSDEAEERGKKYDAEGRFENSLEFNEILCFIFWPE